MPCLLNFSYDGEFYDDDEEEEETESAEEEEDEQETSFDTVKNIAPVKPPGNSPFHTDQSVNWYKCCLIRITMVAVFFLVRE